VAVKTWIKVPTDCSKGDVECLKHDEEEDIWVTRVKWGVGSKGGKPNLTGWDILTIVGGRIKACYTFLDPQ
jgi:hypothetical protein